MEEDDLQIVHLPRNDGRVDSLLYDPMPGGSGLLEQMIDRWEELVHKGRGALKGCPSQCLKSCYDCLRSYYNMFYHGQLDRHIAERMMSEVEKPPKHTGTSPAVVSEVAKDDGGTNLPEKRLAKMLKERGFPAFETQKEIHINTSTIKNTTLDFYYENAPKTIRVAIYLDGMSGSLHGNERTMQVDRFIRATLRSMGIEVIEIAVKSLDDPVEMDDYMRFIGKALGRGS